MNIRIKAQLNVNQIKDKAIWIVFIAIFIGFAVANDRFLTVSNMVYQWHFHQEPYTIEVI